MKQKEVKITGLILNKQLGIIEAKKLIFDKNNKLIVFKGGVGEGKTTLQKGLQLATQGSKTFVDNQLYGDIDLQAQLTDGDIDLFVNCKSKGKKLETTLFTKDLNGKKVTNPIIDGVKATAAKYLEYLQTELTWNMDKLVSENPTTQKNILLKLYHSQLAKTGVIFDKKHPDYNSSILGLIDIAVKNRDEKDYFRKTKGGIADDLKAQGFDPDRPDTCPDEVDISEIEIEIKELEKQKTILESEPEAKKNIQLAEIKTKAANVTNECLTYNNELQAVYDTKLEEYKLYEVKVTQINDNLKNLKIDLQKLYLNAFYENLKSKVKFPIEIKEPELPNYINIVDGQVRETKMVKDHELVTKIVALRKEYSEISLAPISVDTSEITKEIELKEAQKIQAKEINKIVDAIDSFHQWRAANDEVFKLKNQYIKLLAKVDTGVEGLQIIPKDDEIYIMYDGSYDTKYFNNPNKEMRKLSSYSGTQKPVICLLIQNFLLSKKDKAMRYMYIDNVPIDNKTRLLLENMTEELNLHIFLNITGDFEQSNLKDGEILIKGGEVLF